MDDTLLEELKEKQHKLTVAVISNQANIKSVAEDSGKKIQELKTMNETLKQTNEKLLKNQKIISDHIVELTTTYQKIMIGIIKEVEYIKGFTDVDIKELEVPPVALLE